MVGTQLVEEIKQVDEDMAELDIGGDVDIFMDFGDIEVVAAPPEPVAEQSVEKPKAKKSPSQDKKKTKEKQPKPSEAKKKKKKIVISDDEEDLSQDVGSEDEEEVRADAGYSDAVSEPAESLPDVSEEAESCASVELEAEEASDDEEESDDEDRGASKKKRLHEFEETHIISDDDGEEEEEVKVTKIIKPVMKPQKKKKKKVKNPFLDDEADHSGEPDGDSLGDEVDSRELNENDYEKDSFVCDEDEIEMDSAASDDSEPYFSHAQLNNNPDLFEAKQKKFIKQSVPQSKKSEERKEKIKERKKNSKLGKVLDNYRDKRTVKGLEVSDEVKKVKSKYEDISDWIKRATEAELAELKRSYKELSSVTIEKLVELSCGQKLAKKIQQRPVIADTLYSLIPDDAKKLMRSNPTEFFVSLAKSYTWTQFLIIVQYFDKYNLFKLYANPRQRIEFAEKICDKTALLNCFPWMGWYDLFCARLGVYDIKTHLPFGNQTQKEKQKALSQQSKGDASDDKINLAYLQSLSSKEKAARRNRSEFDGVDVEALPSDRQRLEYLNHLYHRAWKVWSRKLEKDEVESLSHVFSCPWTGRPINKTKKDKEEPAYVHVLTFTDRKEFVYLSKGEFNLYNSPFMRAACAVMKRTSSRSKPVGDIGLKPHVEEIKEEKKQPPEGDKPTPKRLASMLGLGDKGGNKKAKMTPVFVQGKNFMIDASTPLFATLKQLMDEKRDDLKDKIKLAKETWKNIPSNASELEGDAKEETIGNLVAIVDENENIPSVAIKILGSLMVRGSPPGAVVVKEHEGVTLTHSNELKAAVASRLFRDIEAMIEGALEFKPLEFKYEDAADFYKKYADVLPLIYCVLNYA